MTHPPDSTISFSVPAGAGRTLTADLHRRLLYGVRPPPRTRKPRRPSISKMIAQAEKATGKPVTSITMPDGTKLDFGQPEPAAPDDPWLADLRKETKQ